MAVMQFFMRIFLVVLLLVPIIAIAAVPVPAWNIIANESSITFTATQNNAPITGQFKNFTGTINFDPEKLRSSNVHIIVDMNSVSASYSDVVTTLKTPDWFDVKLFPQAVFKASDFVKTADKNYQAKGTLTIRDKTLPVTLNFVLEEYSKNRARVKGTTMLKRTQFGVGQGEWAKTDDVKDDVKVVFVLSATKK